MALPTLEDLLVQTRALSAMQIAVAKRDAEMRRRRLAPTLIDLGMMDDARLAQWMSEVTRLPIVHPLPDEAAMGLARRVPRALAREYEVVPIALDGSLLTIATLDVTDNSALQVLQISTGMKIKPVIARHSELQRLIPKLYPDDAAEPTMLPDAMLSFEDDGELSPGSATQVIKPRVPAFVAPTLEARVATIERTLKDIEGRIAAIESAIARVLSR